MGSMAGVPPKRDPPWRLCGSAPVQIALDPIILISTESSRAAHQTHRLATLVCESNFMGGY